MHEVALADVDTGMIPGTRNTEDHDVSGTQIVAADLGSCPGLVPADTRNGDTVSAVTPEDEAGTVEAPGRRGSAVNVGASDLLQGRLCDGGPHTDSLAALCRVTEALFGAAGHQSKQEAYEENNGNAEEGAVLTSDHSETCPAFKVFLGD